MREVTQYGLNSGLIPEASTRRLWIYDLVLTPSPTGNEQVTVEDAPDKSRARYNTRGDVAAHRSNAGQEDAPYTAMGGGAARRHHTDPSDERNYRGPNADRELGIGWSRRCKTETRTDTPVFDRG